MHQRARTPKARCCTQRQIGPVVVVDAVDRHTMVAVDMSKTIGTEEVLTSVDPPRAGGVKVMLEAGKTKPLIVGIVVKRATKRASVGRRN